MSSQGRSWVLQVRSHDLSTCAVLDNETCLLYSVVYSLALCEPLPYAWYIKLSCIVMCLQALQQTAVAAAVTSRATATRVRAGVRAGSSSSMV